MSMSTTISISALVESELSKTWRCYTDPEHIVQWNFAHESWHCPAARNELKVGGTYFARMEARDGSLGFDFKAIYTQVRQMKDFTYVFGGREATVVFSDEKGGTRVAIDFDAETENSIDDQRNGWQAILNNFKAYCESVDGA